MYVPLFHFLEHNTFRTIAWKSKVMFLPESPFNPGSNDVVSWFEGGFDRIVSLVFTIRPNGDSFAISFLNKKNPAFRFLISLSWVSSRVFLVYCEVIVSLLLYFQLHCSKLFPIVIEFNPWIFVGQVHTAYVDLLEISLKILFIDKKRTISRILLVI